MNENEIIEIINDIMELPDEMQQSVWWVIKHIDIVKYLIRGDKLSREEIEVLIQKAMMRT